MPGYTMSALCASTHTDIVYPGMAELLRSKRDGGKIPMNSKEIENASGLTRANIRFYEKEGLLKPQRRENGYRDYTNEDLQCLKKIRLLRELGISLEQIRYLQENPTALEAVMAERIGHAAEEIANRENTIAVCNRIREDQVSYDNMDAGKYLNGMEKQDVLKWDREAEDPHPWKRFLARNLDLLLCSLLVAGVFSGFHKLPPNGLFGGFLNNLLGFGAMLLAEPLFLSHFGTTPGKRIFGITLHERSGRRLTYAEAMKRTWKVLLYGIGLGIPLYNLYCLYRSYRRYVQGEELPWEELPPEAECRIQEKEPWKIVIPTIAVYAVSLAAAVLSALCQFAPKNRGELTTAEFAENYNDYVELFENTDLPGAYLMEKESEEGEAGQFAAAAGWGESEMVGENGQAVIQLPQEPPIRFAYQTEGGVLKAVSFEQTFSDAEMISGYQSQMRYAVLAFAGAQRQVSVWDGSLWKLLRQMDSKQIAYKDYDFVVGDVHVTCFVDYREEQWIPVNNMLLCVSEEEDAVFSIRFSMEKIGSAYHPSAHD